MATRVVKYYSDVAEWDRVHKWYMCCPDRVRPRNVGSDAINVLSYDIEIGLHPTCWAQVRKAAEILWGEHSPYPIGERRDNYVNYVGDRAREAIGQGWLKSFDPRWFDPITTDKLTRVERCHGDMTFMNIICAYGGRVVFIDPGSTQGMFPCRELDEAKVLQSIDGYDQYFGFPQAYRHGLFDVRTVHKALLISHYVRLLRHQNHKPLVMEDARNRIEKLGEEVLSEK